MTPETAGAPRRAWVIFVVVVVCLMVYGVALTLYNNARQNDQTKFQRQIIANCQLLNRAHVSFDAVLDQLARNAQVLQGLSPAQKKRALQVYKDLHLPLQHCPPKP